MALEDAKNEVDTAFTRKGLRGYAFENAFGGATSFPAPDLYQGPDRGRSCDHRRALRSGGHPPHRHPLRPARDPRGVGA